MIINVILVLLIAISAGLWFMGFNPDEKYSENEETHISSSSQNT